MLCQYMSMLCGRCYIVSDVLSMIDRQRMRVFNYKILHAYHKSSRVVQAPHLICAECLLRSPERLDLEVVLRFVIGTVVGRCLTKYLFVIADATPLRLEDML